MKKPYVQAVLMDQGGDEWVFRKVASKVKDGGLHAAKCILMGRVAPRLDATTSEQMRLLHAEPIPAEEDQALRHNLTRLQSTALPTRTPKAATVRMRSLITLRTPLSRR